MSFRWLGSWGWWSTPRPALSRFGNGDPGDRGGGRAPTFRCCAQAPSKSNPDLFRRFQSGSFEEVFDFCILIAFPVIIPIHVWDQAFDNIINCVRVLKKNYVSILENFSGRLRRWKLVGELKDHKFTVKHSAENTFFWLKKTNHWSQCVSCSTKYDTPAGT